MALPNLTNQLIQDTYQRILQVTDDGTVRDGTGSIFAGTYSGSFTGDGSGLTGVPSNIDTGSFAITGSDVLFGHITASGNISASGDIVANNLSGTNTGDQDLSNLITNAQTASFVVNSQTGSFVTNAQTSSFAITGSNILFGNITASGNISASGHLAVNDIHATNFRLMDPLDVTAGPFPMIKTTGALVASTGKVFIGDPDEADTGTHIIIDPPNENVIFKATDAVITGSLTITGGATNLLSVVGNISASGDIVANKVTADVVDTSFETFLNFEAATAFTFVAPFPLTINFTGSSTSSMDVAGFVTASANTSTFSVQQTPPITLNIFDKLKITPSSSGLFSFSGSRTI